MGKKEAAMFDVCACDPPYCMHKRRHSPSRPRPPPREANYKYRSVCRTHSSTGIMKLPVASGLCVSLILSLCYFSLAIPFLCCLVWYFRDSASGIFPEISSIPSRLREGRITISMSAFLFSPSCPEFQKKQKHLPAGLGLETPHLE